LVFIAHSLGGLVCANILAKKTGQSHYSDLVGIAGRCLEVVFLATPFCANDPEAWRVITQKLCPTAKVEANDSSGAIQVQQAFQKLLANRFSKPSFRVENLVEAGDEDAPNVVVTADSAELDSATPVEIKADHWPISKCVDDRNLAFEHILQSLQKVERGEKYRKVEYSADHLFNDIKFGSSGSAHNVFSHHSYLEVLAEPRFKGDVTGRERWKLAQQLRSPKREAKPSQDSEDSLPKISGSMPHDRNISSFSTSETQRK
jgi:hypothetical protein